MSVSPTSPTTSTDTAVLPFRAEFAEEAVHHRKLGAGPNLLAQQLSHLHRMADQRLKPLAA